VNTMATNAAAPMILRISISPLDAKSAQNPSISSVRVFPL
jgi:hypothetical protein